VRGRYTCFQNGWMLQKYRIPCMKRSVTKKPTMETTPEIHNDFTARRPFSDSGPNLLMVERAREMERTPRGNGRLQKIKGASQENKVCRPESAAPISAMSATGKVR
jgi:hypothetical protein